MPYREGVVPPRETPGVSFAAPWAVLAIVAAAAVPLLSFSIRRPFIDAARESGAIVPSLLTTAAVLVVAVAASAAFGGRMRRAAPWLVALAPAVVSLVAWIGTLLPFRPPRGGSFQLGPELLRIVRSCALVDEGSVLVAFVAIGSAAACSLRVWQAIPSASRRTAFRRAAKRCAVTMAAGVVCVGASRAMPYEFVRVPVVAVWFGSFALAIVIATYTWLGSLDRDDLRSGSNAAVFVAASAITATLAAGRIDQLEAQTYRAFHCFSSPTVLSQFAERAENLIVGQTRFAIAAALCTPSVAALFVAIVRAVRVRQLTRRKALFAVAAGALAISIPALALHAIHATGAAFARARLNRAPDYDDADLAVPLLDRDRSYTEPRRTVGIGRRFVWLDGRQIGSAVTFLEGPSRWQTRQLVEPLARLEWLEHARPHRALRVAVDSSHRVKVIRELLDLVRSDGAIWCGLEHALVERQFRWLPSWFDDVRRPHEEIWFAYATEEPSARSVVRVALREHSLLIEAPGGLRVEYEPWVDPVEPLRKVLRFDALRRATAVIVEVDPEVRVTRFMEVLDVVADGREPIVRFTR